MREIINNDPEEPTGASHYLDDIVGGGPTFDSALVMLRRVFAGLRVSGILLKGNKCFLFKLLVKYLGHVFSRSRKGVHGDPAKVEKILASPVPHTPRELLGFLSLAVYYLRFQDHFANTSAPLYALTRKNVAFEWTEDHQAGFDKFKKGLTVAPVLAHPILPGPTLLLASDAS